MAGERGRFDQAMRALLHPRRIAIVGASEKLGFASSIQSVLTSAGFDGDILPVNPRYEQVFGLPAYPSVDTIPGGADLAILAVPQRFIFDVLGQCERAGVGAVNIISSGFAEKQEDATGAERQRALRDFARRTGIRIAGPNCLGNISVPNRMNAMAGPFSKPLHSGPVAAIFQSGLLTYSLGMAASDRGIGFTYIVTSGNEADLDAADYVRYFVDDAQTRVIACFIEEFRDPQRFLKVADLAAERRKPIVVLKIGSSEKGRRAALAHTGSLVGSDAIADAVMRQHGITRVDTIDEMLETMAVFHARVLPKGDGVASWFLSGGAAGLVADVGARLGVAFPDLAPATVEQLERIIPEYGTVGNPLDATGQIWAEPGGPEAVFTTLAEDPNVDIIIYGRSFPGRMDLHPESAEIRPDLPERYPDKVFLVMSLVSGSHREFSYGEEPMKAPSDTYGDVPFLQGVDDGLRAVRSLVRYAAFQRAREQATATITTPPDIVQRARAIVRSATGRPLVEREAKQLLALYGIPVTREHLATSADEAAAAADALGYPVVLKVESPDIAHKTEAGGVLLGVDSRDAAREGFTRIVESTRRYDPAARVAGVLVQEMVTGGRELIVGMSQDPSFGPAIAVGLGGVFVETLRDIALGVPPLGGRDARDLLARLRGYAVLEGSGARGSGPADIDALVDAIARFSRLCLDLRDEVAEIDINPLIVLDRGSGARVVDCLVVPRRDA
jgi:acetyltransferase